MGAFGYGAYDNDDAMDFLWEVGDFLVNQAHSAFRRKNYNVIRTITQFILDNDELTLNNEDIESLIFYLTEISNEWYKSWASPENMELEVTKQIFTLRERTDDFYSDQTKIKKVINSSY